MGGWALQFASEELKKDKERSRLSQERDCFHSCILSNATPKWLRCTGFIVVGVSTRAADARNKAACLKNSQLREQQPCSDGILHWLMGYISASILTCAPNVSSTSAP